MQFDRKLGDKINRGFMLIVFILGAIIAIRFAIAVTKHNCTKVNTNQTTTGH